MSTLNGDDFKRKSVLDFPRHNDSHYHGMFKKRWFDNDKVAYDNSTNAEDIGLEKRLKEEVGVV
jgi:hypothetical protein